jgi:patatin-like phospholipase/acyl hydrolase
VPTVYEQLIPKSNELQPLKEHPKLSTMPFFFIYIVCNPKKKIDHSWLHQVDNDI